VAEQSYDYTECGKRTEKTEGCDIKPAAVRELQNKSPLSHHFLPLAARAVHLAKWSHPWGPGLTWSRLEILSFAGRASQLSPPSLFNKEMQYH
jgi:hypothetical protein